MNKILLLLFLILNLYASEIKTDTVREELIGKILKTNAKIIQLNNQSQNIVSQIGGHIEKYFINTGDFVKKGSPVAKIKSLTISKMSSEFLGLRKELQSQNKRFENLKKLFEKGLTASRDLEQERMKLENLNSRYLSLKMQLKTLGIEKLDSVIDTFIVKAHTEGRVDKIFISLHSNVDPFTPIVSVLGNKKFFAMAYLNIDEALNLPKNIKGELILSNKRYRCSFLQLLPKVDEETQQAKLLFSIENGEKPFLLNAYALMKIEVLPYKREKVIKQTALTMMEGDWVVFIPKEEDEEDHLHKHKEEHHEILYEPKVVKVVEFLGDKAIIKGLKNGEEYVSEGVYFVKSLILKSKLGEHGH